MTSAAETDTMLEVVEVRGHLEEANSALLAEIGKQTARLWRKYHLDYDQTKHVVEQARKDLRLMPPKQRRRTVDRLDQHEVRRLIDAAYRQSAQYGLMVKTLFSTGARVSEFVNIEVSHLQLDLNPPQFFIAHAKGGGSGRLCVWQRSITKR